MKAGLALWLGLASLPLAATASAQTTGASHGQHPAVIAPGDIKWGPVPEALPQGAQLTVLHGDPGKEGPYVMRLKMPDNYLVPAHWHSKDETVTVISGGFGVGVGEEASREKGQILAPGTFAFMPAKTPHYAFAKGETIVQIAGDGPFDLNLVGATGSSQPKK
jgi:quercetin dioxygenase-like cupin family protein